MTRYCGGIVVRKRTAEYIIPLYPPFWRPFIKIAAIFKVISLSEKLRGAEP